MATLAPRSAKAMASGRPTCPQPPITTTSLRKGPPDDGSVTAGTSTPVRGGHTGRSMSIPGIGRRMGATRAFGQGQAAEPPGLYDPRMSTTKTSVSVPLIPACELPCLPYPSAGGIESRTRLPTFCPIRPSLQPGMTWGGEAAMTNPNGAPCDHEASKTFPVRQLTPVYCTMTYWPLVIAGPEPSISVLLSSFLGGLPLGTLIVGGLPDVTFGSPLPPAETFFPLMSAFDG